MTEKSVINILVELSGRLADEEDYDEDIAPKIQQVINYIHENNNPR